MNVLERFVTAQSGAYSTVLRELGAGRKESHWMWFVFPQLAGLGRSAMSVRYAIASLDEARAYLAHPMLGPRLRECTRLVLDSGRTVADVFGPPDDLKFHSCMTLFAAAAGDDGGVFGAALERFWEGAPDRQTTRLLGLA